MQLIYDKPPRIREIFRLSVYTTSGPARVECYVDGQLIFRTDCPDPPCHEQLYVRPEYNDSELLIVGTDRDETREIRLRITDQDTDLAPPSVAKA